MILVKLILVAIYISQTSDAVNTNPFSHPFKGRYTRSIPEGELVVPWKTDDSGTDVFYYLPHFFELTPRQRRTKRDIGGDVVHYRVPIEGDVHHLELEPSHDFLAPGLIVEEHRSDPRGNMSAIEMRNIRSTQCHFRGKVRGVPDSSVVLSTCYGLAGRIRLGNKEFLIEPLNESEETEKMSHVIHKRATGSWSNYTNCGTKGKRKDAWKERLEWEKKHGSYVDSMISGNSTGLVKRDCGCPSICTNCPPTEPPVVHPTGLYLETMIVVDIRALNCFIYHDIETYILTIVNMIAANFMDSTLGCPILFKLVRLLIINYELPELDVLRYSPQKLLHNFCVWQMSFNPRKDNHPNHHDFAIFITRFEPCQGGVVGVSNIASVCRPDKSATVVQEEGLLLANIITHQLGHSLGAEHDDGENGGCIAEEPDGTKYHMGPVITQSSSEWSSCSMQCIKQFISTHAGWCLGDIPADHDYQFPKILPGMVYSSTDQCSLNFHIRSMPCKIGEFCKTLYCQVSEFQCISSGDPPAPGTPCAAGMWCFGGECVHRGIRPGVVNGQWGEWSEWTTCTRSCGGGIQSAYRACDSPAPCRGGRPCEGKWIRHRMCNVEPCAGFLSSFADLQCKMTNEKWYRNRHWVWSHYQSTFDAVGCGLVCINDRGMVALRSPIVIDGTPCHGGTRDVCIEGNCKSVGCDWVIGSKAKEDACGICHGNGTTCRLMHGYFVEPNITGVSPFLKLPIGSSMIYIREMNPSTCFLSITNSLNNTYYLRGDQQLAGSILIGGSFGVYEKKMEVERLYIRNPISVPITFNVMCTDEINRGMVFQYALPEYNPNYVPIYRWVYLDWEECSHPCGTGTQRAKPVCLEVNAGEVEDHFCQKSMKPPDACRTCNTFPCIAKWWVSPWSDCDCVNGEGMMIRSVMCIKSKDIDSLKGEIVREKECCGQPKPKTERPCNLTKELELLEAKIYGSRLKRFADFLRPYDESMDEDSDIDESDKTKNLDGKIAEPAAEKKEDAEKEDDDEDDEKSEKGMKDLSRVSKEVMDRRILKPKKKSAEEELRAAGHAKEVKSPVFSVRKHLNGLVVSSGGGSSNMTITGHRTKSNRTEKFKMTNRPKCFPCSTTSSCSSSLSVFERNCLEMQRATLSNGSETPLYPSWLITRQPLRGLMVPSQMKHLHQGSCPSSTSSDDHIFYRPTSASTEPEPGQADMPSRIDSAHHGKLLVAPVSPYKSLHGQTDAEYQFLGRVGVLPVGSEEHVIDISGPYILQVLEETRRKATQPPQIMNDEPN